jgi:hypothetical protein
MARTLSDILIDVNSTLDLEASLPTGDELATRTNYANQAVLDASATGQLSEFKMEYVVGVSSNATVPLPSNFRELQQDPEEFAGGAWTTYPEISIEEKYDKGTDDEYCYILGNPASGYNLILNSSMSGATLSVIYQRFPSGLLTLVDKCELSDPQFVSRKVESYVLWSRNDERFPIAEQRAEQQLANMMGREMKSPGGQGRDTKMKFVNPLANLS